MTRPKINPKQDLREKTSLDSKMLKLAKEQEKKNALSLSELTQEQLK